MSDHTAVSVFRNSLRLRASQCVRWRRGVSRVLRTRSKMGSSNLGDMSWYIVLEQDMLCHLNLFLFDPTPRCREFPSYILR